jgi:peptidyl-prolyl cis-trans isomerase B (cyclophilin B)
MMIHRFQIAASIALLALTLVACSKESTPPSDTTSSPAAIDPLAEIDAFIASVDKEKGGDGRIDRTSPVWRERAPRPPEVKFDPAKTYVWVLETDRGTMRAKLFTDTAPMHCSSTVYLTRIGFYDGLTFHRVMRQFMGQGGCPKGDGTGGPGYQMVGEFRPEIRHDRPYLVSMANAGPRTDGSQFFVTFIPTPMLDGKHTIFGELMDEESRRAARAIEDLAGPAERPTSPIRILKASIEVK